MQRGFWIAATVVALGCSLAAGWQAWQPPRLPLEATPSRLDFGEVRQGATLPLEFTLVNTTDQPVRLEGIYPACDCTQFELSQAKLEPGDSLVLRGQWSVGARRWESETHVAVSYRVAEHAPYSLRLAARARVIPDLKLEPETLVFSADGPTELILAVSPNTETDMIITDVVTTHQAMEATIINSSPRGAVLSVRLRPHLTQRDDGAQVIIATSAPHEGRLRVPVAFP